MTTIIVISQPTNPPPPPPPPNQSKAMSLEEQSAALRALDLSADDENCAPTRVSSYNAALRALNDAFEAGCAIRVVDA